MKEGKYYQGGKFGRKRENEKRKKEISRMNNRIDVHQLQHV